MLPERAWISLRTEKRPRKRQESGRLSITNSLTSRGSRLILRQVSLSADLSCGSVSTRVLVNEYFDFPATMIRKGNSFYTVMSKFGVEPGDIATTAYEIVRTDRDGGVYMCSDA